MADIIIPPALGISSVAWALMNTSRGGGVSFTGTEQVIMSPSGRWTATMTFNVFSGIEDPAALIYRSLVRRGRGATILVPETDTRGPAEFAGLPTPSGGVPFSDDAKFSDGTGFAQTRTGGTLASPAAMNATQVQITLGAGLTLVPGMRFSTPDNRMHEIDDILAFDGGTGWTVAVAPWLRADYPADTPLNFDKPTCRMRLASDDTGKLTISSRALSTPTIEFVEAI